MVEQTEQTVRQAPYIEERSEQLLASVFGDPNAVQQDGESDADFALRRYGRAGVGRQIPAYEVAGFSPDQFAAMQLARSGIGGFAPFMNLGASTLGAGVGTALSGAPALPNFRNLKSSSDSVKLPCSSLYLSAFGSPKRDASNCSDRASI